MITIPRIFMRSMEITQRSVFAGQLPPRALGMVMEWAALHREELLADWARARSQQELQKIAPLER
jgi:hypothetical protein